MEICREGMDNLRCAIVERAAKDYLYSKKVIHIEGSKHNREHVRTVNECVKFFNSRWYNMLIHSIDGATMLKMLDDHFNEWTQDEEAVSKFIVERSKVRRVESEGA